MHHLTGLPSPELARKLAAFEEQFVYPLGPGRHFRITHGNDYPRFFRAMGEAAVFVVEREERIAATLAVVVRRLTLPDGGSRPVAYFGDLKIASWARGGVTLMRLVHGVDAWVRPKVDAAFSVVMDGTPVTPEAYTGRLSIPLFRVIGKVVVLRLICGTGFQSVLQADRLKTCPTSESMACFQRLNRSRYFCGDATPSERSETDPTWLVAPDEQACALFEDTRRGKRLIADDGRELLSAHLSYFACATPAAGADLLRAAVHRSRQLDFPALFVAVSEPDVGPLRAALSDLEIVAAPATIYAANLEADGLWNINTAEI